MSNDTFQWTDELVNDYVRERIIAPGDYLHTQLDDRLKSFKQSKMPKKSAMYYHTPPYPEKEWEIVSYMPPSNHPIPATNTLVDLYDFPIHSVRRLSDNEVFTTGDVNEYPTGLQETIKEFRVNESNSGMMLFRTDNVWSNLSLAKKPQPKKERIEVKDVGIESILIKFEGRRLSVGEIEQVKAAIEKIINYD